MKEVTVRDYSNRNIWARAVLDRLRFGLGKDSSGFYRPARLPRSGRTRLGRARVDDTRQLSLPFDPLQV